MLKKIFSTLFVVAALAMASFTTLSSKQQPLLPCVNEYAFVLDGNTWVYTPEFTNTCVGNEAICAIVVCADFVDFTNPTPRLKTEDLGDIFDDAEESEEEFYTDELTFIIYLKFAD